ncbi:glycerol-3-phosphate 1-O-acyltransferase PlsY [Desulfolithobacter sp.]
MAPKEIVLIVISYLVGAIPFGLLVSLPSGIDIRTRGSGNIGATNVARLLGRKLGLLTLFLDIAKGFLPMYLAGFFISGQEGGQHNLIIALCGAATIIGHMFPVYLRFRGGKGVATGLGVFLYLTPLAVLGCLVVFVAAVWLTGYVSLGSLLASATVILWLWLLGEPSWELWLGAFVAVMIWIKHYQNIGRLLRGTEKSWRASGTDENREEAGREQ